MSRALNVLQIGYVDIAILCNNMRLICMLAYDILCMLGPISHEHPQEVMTELYFYRDQEEMKEDQAGTEEKTVTKDLLLKGVFQIQFHR
ncbi:40S ribosomal protein SA [Microtus ochrogaster]|uniref:40S ribosomal protein SA n=1 Tax=Microtus ochrogaster TaxID=79684 RepID=A0A8J6G209_MICOH|nr:40S ribosomal protein SA [Microtus ochrogaster]